jgi:hypothetical protein
VGHAPSEVFTQLTASQRRAMFVAEDLLSSLPEAFEALVVEQRPRTMTREGVTVDVHDILVLSVCGSGNRQAHRRSYDEVALYRTILGFQSMSRLEPSRQRPLMDSSRRAPDGHDRTDGDTRHTAPETGSCNTRRPRAG